jgi:hypothetical protein
MDDAPGTSAASRHDKIEANVKDHFSREGGYCDFVAF